MWACTDWSHSKGFSPLCVLLCCVRCPAWLKHLPRWSHSKGFSPVCVLLCFFRSLAWLQHFPHWSHSIGFFALCVLLCLVRCPALLKHLFYSSRKSKTTQTNTQLGGTIQVRASWWFLQYLWTFKRHFGNKAAKVDSMPCGRCFIKVHQNSGKILCRVNIYYTISNVC